MFIFFEKLFDKISSYILPYLLNIKIKIYHFPIIKNIVGDFPNGFCEDIIKLAKEKGWKVETHIIPEFTRKKPYTIENTIHKNYYRQYHLKEHSVNIIRIPSARIVTDEGNVVTPNNLIIDNMYFPIARKKSKVRKILKLPKEEYIDKRILAIPNVKNYFHWMIEVLPRFNYVKNFDLVAFPYELKFQKESLEMLNIPKENVIYYSNSTNIKAKEVIIPLMPIRSGNPYAETCKFVRELFLKKEFQNKKYERIYVTRGAVKHRKVINEKKIKNYLKHRGFTFVSMDGLTIQKQAEIFNSAKIIVAPHGAALTNLIFAKKGTKVIEFFAPDYVNVCFWAISNSVNLNYHYFLGEKIHLNYSINTKIKLDKLESSLTI